MESKKESIKKSINSGTYFSNVFSIFGETNTSKSFKEITQKLEKDLKNIEQDADNENKKDVITETNNKSEESKKEKKKEEVITNTPDKSTNEPLLVETSGMFDKWSKKSIDEFNGYLTTIKQSETYSDDKEINEIAKNNFNNLKLIGFKGKLDGYVTFMLLNNKSNIMFEVFKNYDKDKNENDIQVTLYLDSFDYRSTAYKRQSIAKHKPTKKERDEYLNQYCYVDFKLLPKEKDEKSA